MRTLDNFIQEKLVIDNTVSVNDNFRITEIKDIIDRAIEEQNKKMQGSLKLDSYDLTYEEEPAKSQWYNMAYILHIKPKNSVFSEIFIKKICNEIEESGKYSWLSRNDDNNIWTIKIYVKKSSSNK